MSIVCSDGVANMWQKYKRFLEDNVYHSHLSNNDVIVHLLKHDWSTDVKNMDVINYEA
jgi:hypothetical protein